ncbi:MAG: hypothetical protein Terrestrivirus5_23 [Terrestrivirus sp.]|uniref:CR-type domain-containing protein n=1 Tax=Terrestrivirus sp. TaxID=2487775 RepID=A0A3G4ZQD3_9VIRU|nr:MAG: hypothetical protein Terrestrivirus5_23 [Terrestrivirus sp.]
MPCSNCNDTRIIRTSTNCSQCGGAGTIINYQSNYRPICTTCNGSGKFYSQTSCHCAGNNFISSYSTKCYRCKGTGECDYVKDTTWRKCTNCKEVGYIYYQPHKCTKCEGTGFWCKNKYKNNYKHLVSKPTERTFICFRFTDNIFLTACEEVCTCKCPIKNCNLGNISPPRELCYMCKGKGKCGTEIKDKIHCFNCNGSGNQADVPKWRT